MFKWESEKERLLKHSKMPPKKKLEWLREMHEFIVKYSPKSHLLIKQKLKKMK